MCASLSFQSSTVWLPAITGSLGQMRPVVAVMEEAVKWGRVQGLQSLSSSLDFGFWSIAFPNKNALALHAVHFSQFLEDQRPSIGSSPRICSFVTVRCSLVSLVVSLHVRCTCKQLRCLCTVYCVLHTVIQSHTY